jgi:hypothetical protein
MTKIYVKFFDNEGNIVLLPVTDSDPVPPVGFKPAESYTSARNRNCKNATHSRFVGSVLLFGRS